MDFIVGAIVIDVLIKAVQSVHKLIVIVGVAFVVLMKLILYLSPKTEIEDELSYSPGWLCQNKETIVNHKIIDFAFK